MKYLITLFSTIIFYRPSKIGVVGIVLLGMIMGRIAANFVINASYSQINIALFVIVICVWSIIFIRKVISEI